MPLEDGKTSIIEIATGFVGSVFKGKTLDGRPKVRVDICCRYLNEITGDYPIWRHVYLSGKTAEIFADVNLAKGDKFKAWGFLVKQKISDYDHQFLLDHVTGQPVIIEKLICNKAERLEYEKQSKDLQLALEQVPI